MPQDDATSVQSQDNLIHIIESEQYTPSQIIRALQTALDDSRSYHFDKVVQLPRVQELHKFAPSTPESVPGKLILELVSVFANGAFAEFLSRKDDFSSLTDQNPQRIDKLKSICLRRLDAALLDPRTFDFSTFLDLLDPSCAEALGSQGTSALKILDLLAYRNITSSQYKAIAPSLAPPHVHKLRQLSLAEAAATQKVLTYDTLLQHLSLSTDSELEDFLIEAITSEIVIGKINQKEKVTSDT